VRAEPICEVLERMRAAGAGLEVILREAVRELHDAHELFHWTGIYELYPDGVLRLGPYVGAPTDHVFIAVGRGVCGTAVAERRNQNIPDVTKATNYLACSSDTKSELVVLIRRGERIWAQIDIDSHQIAAFDAATAREVEKLADWLATCYAARERN
jgi:GAF domain-containing protein